MKKIISLILVFCMAVSMLCMPAAVSASTDYTRSWQIVKALGIISWDDSQKQDSVTRGEFAQMLSDAFRLVSDGSSFKAVTSTFGNTTINTSFADDTAEPSVKTTFTDVPSGHSNYTAISAVCAYGIMKGSGDSFNPDKLLKYEEALKTLVVLCGYETEALIKGGWYVGYGIMGDKLDIELADKGFGTTITKMELSHMLRLALEVDIAEISSIVNDTVYYTSTKGKTFGEAYFDIEMAEGQVTRSLNSTITAPLNSVGDTVVVDGVEMLCSEDISVAQYLGRTVNAYYKVELNTKRLIYMTYADYERTTVIDARDLGGYDNGVITYTAENGRNKTINVRRYPVIYNGSAVPVFDKTLFDIEYGEVIITKGADTDVVIVREFKDMIVSAITDVKETKIYDELTGTQLVLGDSELIYYYKPDGSPSSFEAIASGTVISYLAGSNYKELYIGLNSTGDNIKVSTTKTGILGSVDVDNGIVNVAGAEYGMSDYAASQGPETMIGSNVTAYLNRYGEVFFISLSGAFKDLNGYLAAIAPGSGFGNQKARVFTSEGKIEDYNFASKVTVLRQDGVTTLKPSGDAVRSALQTAGVDYTGYVVYKLNSKGEIYYLELPLESYSLKKENDGRIAQRKIDVNRTANPYMKNHESFGGQIYFDNSVKIFGIPANESEYEKYELVPYSAFNNYETVTSMTAYFVDFDDPIPEALVLHGWTTQDIRPTASNMHVVKKITKGIDAEGELISNLDVVAADGVVTTLFVTEKEKGKTLFDAVPNLSGTDTAPIEPGDVVIYNTLSNSKEVVRIWRVFDADKDNGIGGKLGYLADVAPGSDQYFLKKSSFDISNYDEYNFPNVTEQIVSLTGLSAGLKNQNPFRIDLNEPEEANMLKDNTYRYYPTGKEFFLGYVADKADAFFLLTTQDLSRGVEYKANGIPDETLVRSDLKDNADAYNGIYHQRWFRYVNNGGYILTLELYDNGIEIRKGTPEDIYSYKEAGPDSSRVLANFNDKRYIIINDYRSR